MQTTAMKGIQMRKLVAMLPTKMSINNTSNEFQQNEDDVHCAYCI